VVGDNQVGAVQALDLVDQHLGALVVDVVCNQKSSGSALVAPVVALDSLVGGCCRVGLLILVLLCRLANARLFSNVQHLDQLSTLASRGSAQVENGVVRLDIEKKRRNHRNSFLATDVADGRLGDEELLESGEGRELADDILRRGHVVGQLVGVPRNGHRGLDILVVKLHRLDLGDKVFVQVLLHGESVSAKKSVFAVQTFVKCRWCVPFATTEAERVGQLATESSPELFALLSLRDNVHVIVQPLELLVDLGDFGVRLALSRPVVAAASTALALVLEVLPSCQLL
jgi:hypothetical protein